MGCLLSICKSRTQYDIDEQYSTLIVPNFTDRDTLKRFKMGNNIDLPQGDPDSVNDDDMPLFEQVSSESENDTLTDDELNLYMAKLNKKVK